jgi:hypothetical protein
MSEVYVFHLKPLAGDAPKRFVADLRKKYGGGEREIYSVRFS